MLEFIGTCCSLRAEHLHDYDDTERPITYRTFLKHLGAAEMRELNVAMGYDTCPGLSISSDWSISFGKGKWRGETAVCMHHSATHHIWLI